MAHGIDGLPNLKMVDLSMATLNNQRVTYSQTRGNWCSKLCIFVYIPEKLCLSIMSCFSCWECHWIGIWRFPICSYMDFLLYVLYVPISSWVCAYIFRFYVIFPIFSYNFMDVFLYFPWLSCKTTGYFARHWMSMENFLHHFFGLRPAIHILFFHVWYVWCT